MTLLRALVCALVLLGSMSAAPLATSAEDLPTRQVPVEGGGSYTEVGPAGLATMLQAKDFPLVNVHIPYEAEIEGTDLFIPFNEVEARLDQLPADRAARVVLYCRSGSMGAAAARTLVQLGYTDVWNLDGGMIAWAQSGYPLVEQAR